MVNQKEIAARAGVSRATVSRAFTQSANISPKTLAKIQQAMVSLGLEPFPWFPRVSGKRNNYVLIIAGDIANDFYARIIKGICDKLQILGIHSIVCNSNYSSQFEEERIRFAQEEGYLGIILVTAVENEAFVDLLRKTTIPVILVNRYIRSLDVDTVCIDNYMGGYMAANYLLQRNHKKLVLIAGSANSTPQQDRVRGFDDAVKDSNGSGIVYDVFYGDQTSQRGHTFAETLIKNGNPYTAAFIPDWHIASGLVTKLKNHGIRVPDDLSVICFDDSPVINELGLDLTTISHDPYLMGCNTAETLLHRIESKSLDKYRLLLAPRLIERTSVSSR